MEHLGTVLLETDRLILRRFYREDGESCLQNWAADPQVYRWISQVPQTGEEIDRWLSAADEAYASADTYYWAIQERAGGQIIGEIFVDDYGERNRWCELDWKLGPAFWNQGYTTEAAKAVIRFLTERVGFHRVQAKCCAENAASRRVMEKAGMAQEGILRDFFLGKDGLFHHVVLYAILDRSASRT